MTDIETVARNYRAARDGELAAQVAERMGGKVLLIEV